MFNRNKSGLTLTKQSTINKHYGIIAGLILLFGIAMWGNVKQYTHAQTFETTIKQQQLDVEAAQRERDEAKKKVTDRIENVMKVSSAIRSIYPKVPMGKSILIADAQIRYSAQYGIGKHYGLGVSGIESGFNPYAVSYNGTSYGTMQVHYNVWKKEIPGLTKTCLHDIDCGIKTGYEILSRYRRQANGNMYAAFKLYYGATDPVENDKYATRVKTNAQRFLHKLS